MFLSVLQVAVCLKAAGGIPVYNQGKIWSESQSFHSFNNKYDPN